MRQWLCKLCNTHTLPQNLARPTYSQNSLDPLYWDGRLARATRPTGWFRTPIFRIAWIPRFHYNNCWFVLISKILTCTAYIRITSHHKHESMIIHPPTSPPASNLCSQPNSFPQQSCSTNTRNELTQPVVLFYSTHLTAPISNRIRFSPNPNAFGYCSLRPPLLGKPLSVAVPWSSRLPPPAVNASVLCFYLSSCRSSHRAPLSACISAHSPRRFATLPRPQRAFPGPRSKSPCGKYIS